MLIRINGILRFYQIDFKMSKVSAGKWSVTNFRGTYTVIGGKKAGGARNEWFVDGPEINGYINCKSMHECLKIISSL